VFGAARLLKIIQHVVIPDHQHRALIDILERRFDVPARNDTVPIETSLPNIRCRNARMVRSSREVGIAGSTAEVMRTQISVVLLAGALPYV